MHDMKEDIKNTINNNINEKFKNLEMKNEHLENKIKEHSLQINNIERFMRRKNLIFFGVEEGEKSYNDLENAILHIINKCFGFNFENGLESVRRIGKKGEIIRPVVVTFSTMGFKLKIQQNQKCLKGTPYYVKQDFPKEVLKKRKELQPQLKVEREAGNTAFIKYDKLIVLPRKNKTSTQNPTNKRSISESPETTLKNPSNILQNKKQSVKKSKTTTMKEYIRHKPKFILNSERTTHDSTPSEANEHTK
ncbi:unnamed protein product [Parnassius apollo]|uniref:(apollo) hypothetical protein n=1 Tax=Parnassius apollo TaxID=110799 RepID=A0A8S3XF94_PARAO|nr:unnamed protein product [Parnassius apollo]